MKEIKMIMGEMTKQNITLLGEAINDGFEILKFDTQWVNVGGQDNTYNITPNMIAVLTRNEGKHD